METHDDALLEELNETIGEALERLDVIVTEESTIYDRAPILFRMAIALHEENKELRGKLNASNSSELPNSSTGA